MTAQCAFARDLAPRLIKRQAPAPVAAPVKARTAPVAALDPWLGELHLPREQRPGQPSILAVGRLRRQDGSRGLLIHAVTIGPAAIEIRHRITEPDGPFIIVGTMMNGAGRLDLNADDASKPTTVWAVMEPRRRHPGWNLFRKRGTPV